ncbi:MAG: PIN domain-containing protein [Acidobacteria bacterium]|nr:PIN domain-containing protein [Acidobacteriota bacterium]
MSVFVDTNVLLRAADPGDPKHEAATRTISELLETGETLCITPQIAAEFWNVATRPVANNGLGMSIDEVRDEISRLERFFSVLPESIEVYSERKRLVAEHKVQGVKVHDARIVAAMNVHGITRIVTFNADDFRRYGSITATLPS